MAMSSRYVEVFSFTRQSVDGYNNDRFLLGAESALRVSLSFFLFFTLMFVTTVWTKKLHECRNFWNSNLGGPLLVKIFMVAVCLYLAQIPTSSYIELYGNIARAGAGLFLIIQLISVTKFIVRANTWQQLNPERLRWLVRPTTILLNFGSFGVIFWLLHENRSNTVEFAIAGITLVLMVIMICIYLKSEVTTGWLALGLMLFYIMAMSWTVIRSVPHRESAKANDPKGPDWLTIVSLCFMAYSTLSIGEDDWLQFNNEEQSEDNIPYGFGYFHLVFALGAMYFGMILVGWNAYQTMQRWTVDFGWWSAIVRAINGFLGAVLYIWMLRTPFIWTKEKLVLSFPEASWVPHATFI
uniref:Uncharacterized protein n=1 Tax=Avena sativa TaxID=4498 RepID=A0ACD5WJ92_AVESA